jgi:hypothetical protein
MLTANLALQTARYIALRDPPASFFVLNTLQAPQAHSPPEAPGTPFIGYHTKMGCARFPQLPLLFWSVIPVGNLLLIDLPAKRPDFHSVCSGGIPQRIGAEGAIHGKYGP